MRRTRLAAHLSFSKPPAWFIASRGWTPMWRVRAVQTAVRRPSLPARHAMWCRRLRLRSPRDRFQRVFSCAAQSWSILENAARVGRAPR